MIRFSFILQNLTLFAQTFGCKISTPLFTNVRRFRKFRRQPKLCKRRVLPLNLNFESLLPRRIQALLAQHVAAPRHSSPTSSSTSGTHHGVIKKNNNLSIAVQEEMRYLRWSRGEAEQKKHTPAKHTPVFHCWSTIYLLHWSWGVSQQQQHISNSNTWRQHHIPAAAATHQYTLTELNYWPEQHSTLRRRRSRRGCQCTHSLRRRSKRRKRSRYSKRWSKLLCKLMLEYCANSC